MSGSHALDECRRFVAAATTANASNPDCRFGFDLPILPLINDLSWPSISHRERLPGSLSPLTSLRLLASLCPSACPPHDMHLEQLLISAHRPIVPVIVNLVLRLVPVQQPVDADHRLISRLVVVGSSTCRGRQWSLCAICN